MSVTDHDSVTCNPADDSCHLCGDVAVAGHVLEVNTETRTALVAFDNGSATVALDLVDAGVGDRILVHLGFAIERIDA